MERSISVTGPSDGSPAADRHAAEIAALVDGAALLLRAGNRVSAVAALWSAVSIDPCHLGAHRRLAATLANSGDVGGAVAEYERFIAALTAAGHPERAAAERRYGHTLLGDAIPLDLERAAAPALPVAGGTWRAEQLATRRLAAEQSQALRRLAVAGVALVATFAAMLIAGSQIFAQGL